MDKQYTPSELTLPVKKNGRYCNPHLPSDKRSLKDFFLFALGYFDAKTGITEVPEGFTYPNPKLPCDPSLPHAFWVNHSTFYISCFGCNIVTDPIWSKRCSPLSSVGPRRLHPPAVDMEMLPPLHYVIISHNHYDHLDEKSIRSIQKRNPDCIFIVPTGVKKWFKKRGIIHVVEFSWWESAEFSLPLHSGSKIKFTAVPTQHFSGRGLLDTNRSLWSGFVIDFTSKKFGSKRVYFCGDSGYNPHDFKQIGARFGEMDLSLIPVGTYVPDAFMTTVHMNPYQATAVHQDVGSRLSIGMHFKTFRLSKEPPQQPPYDLFLSMKNAGLDPLQFRILEPGQLINW